jgi:hypothetical protein
MNKPLFDNGMERRVKIEKLAREHVEEGPFGDIRRTIEFDRLIVWAEPGLKDIFTRIKGVLLVSPDSSVGARYVVSIDPRYNTEWVMGEIEAVAIMNFDNPSSIPFPTIDAVPDRWAPTFDSDSSSEWIVWGGN